MKEPFVVMVRAMLGTHRLVDNGNRWEPVMHTITWASYQTLQEAQQVANDLNTGMRTGRAWVEDDVQQQRRKKTA